MPRTAHELPHTGPSYLDDPYAPLPPLPMTPATRVTALAPPDPAILGPVAPGTITLIKGPRGIGKSWLALAMAHAIAGGSELLGWHGRAAPVIHVDAAMTEAAIGARLRAMGKAQEGLGVIGDRMIDLGEFDAQLRFMGELPEGGVLVLDGLSLLVPSGRGGRWHRFCEWVRKLRQNGEAVILVDHVNRPAIEALADTLITLRPVRDETSLAFTAEIVSRQALPAADRAFTVRLDLGDGMARWTREAEAVDPKLQEIAEAARAGGTVRDIAAALGLPTATAWRRLKQARALGLIADGPRESGETPAAATAPATPDDTPRETGETAKRSAGAPMIRSPSASGTRRVMQSPQDKALIAACAFHSSPQRGEGGAHSAPG